MRLFREKENCRVDPLIWFGSHLGSINHAMYEYFSSGFDALRAMRRPVFDQSSYLPMRMTEEGFCHSWDTIKDLVGLPSGFEVVHGSVKLNGIHLEHTFLRSGRGRHAKIFCHTSAQFMHGTNKGEKAAALKEKALQAGSPGLVQTLGNYTVVYGEVHEIQKALGLGYSSKKAF